MSRPCHSRLSLLPYTPCRYRQLLYGGKRATSAGTSVEGGQTMQRQPRVNISLVWCVKLLTCVAPGLSGGPRTGAIQGDRYHAEGVAHDLGGISHGQAVMHGYAGRGRARVQHRGAARQPALLALVVAACMVSVWLLCGTPGQAEDGAVTVVIASIPALEHLHPPTDLARVTITALLHGKPLSHGHMKVQLTAPPQTIVQATDTSSIEGTPLFVFNSELVDGSVTLEYRFPLCGVYTFDLEITPVPGGPVFPPTRLRQMVRIPDTSGIMQHPWLLIVGLFVLGTSTGVLVRRVVAARTTRRSRALLGLLVVCCSVLVSLRMVAAHPGHAEHAAHGTPERQVIQGDDGWALELHTISMPVTVGHLLQLALWLRKDEAVFPGMTEILIAAVNLEKGQPVVEINILARQGSTVQSLQLYESEPHAITVTVRPMGGANRWTPPAVTLNVEVIAGNPALAVQIRRMVIWLGVLMAGLVIGGCVPYVKMFQICCSTILSIRRRHFT